MIRTHIFTCHLPQTEADALNQESGRVYTQTVIWHYRVYRRTGHWLSQGAAEKLGDHLSSTSLHAHSRDAAQQAFYKACKTTQANRGMGAHYPHRLKKFRTTIWKNTGIRLRDGKLLLARARGLEPISLSLPPDLVELPKAAFAEMRLVYDRGGQRYNWHAVIEDGRVPADPPGDKVLAVDLGEIHPAAVANERGAVVIFTARALRSLDQYRHKKLAALQARQAKTHKGSRLWKRLKRRKAKLLARDARQRRDIEHKVTRAVTDHAIAEKASRVVVGDVRDIGDGKRLNTHGQQKVSGWSHGRQVQYLSYKLAAAGIGLEQQNEAWSSKTCSYCGALNRADGRNYRCSSCGAVTHRDANGAVNQESKALYGCYGRIQPISIMYRRPFNRGRSSPDTAHVALKASHE